MSLTSSLLIGRSALAASQLAIQVTGDNIANAATPGYHRRVATLLPVPGGVDSQRISIGRGVEVDSVRRQIDLALQTRLRDSGSQHTSSLVEQEVLSQIEALISDLEGLGLSDQLSVFFNAFSELANNPSATETRALIVEEGQTLAQYIRRMRTELTSLRSQIDAQLGANVGRADELLREIAGLNRAISNAEQGLTEDAALRDQRDLLLSELSELIDISVHEQQGGAVDVYVGSTPVVLGTSARGLELDLQSGVDGVNATVIVAINGDKLAPNGGRIGGLLEQRNGALVESIDALDSVASGLIFEVNRIHSSGRPFPGLTDTTGWQRVAAADQTLSFNDTTNDTFADLPFQARNGSFTVHVVDQASGLVQKHQIFVDLDGVDSTGAAGFGGDTSLASLVADLDALANVNAEIDTAGRLRIYTDSGFEIGFSDDTSGALGLLGINTFFIGHDATDIGVREELVADPSLLVAGVDAGTNEAARGIAALRTAASDILGGLSIEESWHEAVNRVAVSTRGAATRAEAAGQVRASLEAQRSAVSGVSIDEESINLLNYQRQYQAAARFISTVDELTQTLLSLV